MWKVLLPNRQPTQCYTEGTCSPYKNAGPARSKNGHNSIPNLKCNFKTLFVEFYWQLWGFSSSFWIFHRPASSAFAIVHLSILKRETWLLSTFCVCVFVRLHECGSLIEIENRMQRIDGREQLKKRTSSFSLDANRKYDCIDCNLVSTHFWLSQPGPMVQLIDPFSGRLHLYHVCVCILANSK